MGYDVADIKPLEYNFGEYGDGETHVIKEPTDKMARRFIKRLGRESDQIGLEVSRINQAERELGVQQEGESDEDYRARFEREHDDIADRQEAIGAASRHRVLEWLSEVCSGDPTVEQLEKLPERMLVGDKGFLTYIRVELSNPKG